MTANPIVFCNQFFPFALIVCSNAISAESLKNGFPVQSIENIAFFKYSVISLVSFCVF